MVRLRQRRRSARVRRIDISQVVAERCSSQQRSDRRRPNTGEVVNRTLMPEGSEVREFYSQLPHPAVVGIEAIGPMQWFLNLLEELGIEC